MTPENLGKCWKLLATLNKNQIKCLCLLARVVASDGHARAISSFNSITVISLTSLPLSILNEIIFSDCYT